MKKKFLWMFIALGAALLASTVYRSESVYAITESDLLTKALYGGMRGCYKDLRMKGVITTSSYLYWNDAIVDETTKAVVLPTLVGNDVTSSTATCKEIFEGAYEWRGPFSHPQTLKGIIERSGKNPSNDYKNLGYNTPVPGSAESPMKCISLKYQFTPPGSTRSQSDVETNRICFPVGADGKVNIVNPDVDVYVEPAPTEDGKVYLRFNRETYEIYYNTKGWYRENSDLGTALTWLYDKTYDEAVQLAVDNLNALDWEGEGFIAIGAFGDPFESNYAVTATSPIKVFKSEYGESTYTKMTFRNSEPLLGAEDALRFFTGSSTANFDMDNYKFVNDDWIALYKIYFQRMSNQYPQLRVTDNCVTKKDSFTYAWYDGAKWCEISGVDSITENLAWKDTQYTLKLISFSAMTRSYMGLDFGEVDTPDDLDPDTPAVEPDPIPEESVNKSSCAGLNAAGSLSWILCPILELAGNATNWLYENAIEPFLQTESSFLNTDSGTYSAWQLFQNIANVFSIALLLIVIFSQVTGVGIDNYGIKRILPKFVIAVVLINLSFIICQLAVDISNIAGNGIKTMMENMGDQVTINAIYMDNKSDASSVGVTVGTTGVITALIGVMIAFPGIPAAIGTAVLPFLPGILLALFGAVIGMLLAVLILFVLLTARKIAVVILVVLAPLAFAMYMLPNTKSLFDKWFKFLKNMLLMYPICGLVIGGGNLAGKIILSSGLEANDDGTKSLSFMMALAGMLASIVPFFFIPKLLRGSMDAFGNIGSKMSNFGKSMSGKVKGLAGGSDFAKDMQRRAVMARNQKVFDRYQKREQAGKSLSGYQRRRMNNARLAYNNAAREDIAAAAGGAMLEEGTTAYNAALAMQESSVSKQELENQIVAMANDTDNYDVKNMSSKLTKLLSSPTELSHEDEVMMKALMKQLTVKGGFGKKELASVLSGASSATRAQAAKFMSKDGDVAAAVNKNMMVAQYMREVNSGQVAGNVNFDTWQQNNAQRVLTQVITNDTDFANQSASAVKSQLGLLSNERLSAIVNNERVMDAADSEVRDAIIAAAKERGDITIPTRYGGEGAVTGGNPVTSSVAAAAESKDEIPGQMSFVVNDSNELRVHDAGETGKPVDVKIEQPAPKIQTPIQQPPVQPNPQPNPQAQQDIHDQVVEEMKNMPRK